jgi:hypothetical protein
MKDLDDLEMRALQHVVGCTSPPATTGRAQLDTPLAPLTDNEIRDFLNMVETIRTQMANKPPYSRVSRPDTPETRILQQNSITRLEALVPVRVATSKPLDGNWSGRELDATRVVGSLFGGSHFILQFGYNQTVGYTASFRLVFVAHMPADINAPGAVEEAENTATAFMHMLNLRRIEGPSPKSMEGTLDNVNAAVMRASPIPGKSLIQGRRADLLIVDEISGSKPRSPHAIDNLPEDPSKPYVERLDDTLPGKRPV